MAATASGASKSPLHEQFSQLTLRERLLLSQAIYDVGTGNFARVSDIVSKHPLVERPPAFFSPEACAVYYRDLMNDLGLDIDTSKNEIKAAHAPIHLKLARKHWRGRIEEVRKQILEKENEFKRLFQEIEDIRAGRWDNRIVEDLEKEGLIPKTVPPPVGTPEHIQASFLHDEEAEDDRVAETGERPEVVESDEQEHFDVPELDEAARVDVRELDEFDAEPKSAKDVEMLDASPLPADGPSHEIPTSSPAAADAIDAQLADEQLFEGQETESEASSPSIEEQARDLTPQPQDEPTVATGDDGVVHSDLFMPPSPSRPRFSAAGMRRVLSREPTPAPPISSSFPSNSVSSRHDSHDADGEDSEGDDGPHRAHDSQSMEETGEGTPRAAHLSVSASLEEENSRDSSVKIEDVDAAMEETIPEMQYQGRKQPRGWNLSREGSSKRRSDVLGSPFDGEGPHHKRMRVDETESLEGRGSSSRAPSRPPPPTPTTSAVHKRFQSVITMLHTQISAHRNGNIFHQPIKASEAPNYHNVVKRAMDLKTIKARIKDGNITNSAEFQRDIYLMFANAVMFNPPDTDVYIMAEEMMQESEQHIQAFLQTEDFVQLGSRRL